MQTQAWWLFWHLLWSTINEHQQASTRNKICVGFKNLSMFKAWHKNGVFLAGVLVHVSIFEVVHISMIGSCQNIRDFFLALRSCLASNAMSPRSKPWKRPNRLVTDLVAMPLESIEHMYMTTTHLYGIDCILYIYTSTYVYMLHICVYYLLRNIHLHIWALLGWGFDTWWELLQLRAFTFQISKVKVRTVWCIETCINLMLYVLYNTG